MPNNRPKKRAREITIRVSDDELQEAVLKYGDPDDYYN